jgi:hypothetical protein
MKAVVAALVAKHGRVSLDRGNSSRLVTARLLGIDPRNFAYYLPKHGLTDAAGEP